MFRKTLITAFTAAALGPLLLAGAPAQTPANRVLLDVNYGPPPATVEALWAASVVVVRGVVEHSQVRAAIADTPSPTVVTAHRVSVTELLKDSARRVGQRSAIHVLQHAGTLERGGKLFVADPGGMPVFVPGQELLLFLQDWPEANGFSITAGPAGVYVLDGDAVLLPSAVRHFAAAFGGHDKDIPKQEFLATMRAAAPRR